MVNDGPWIDYVAGATVNIPHIDMLCRRGDEERQLRGGEACEAESLEPIPKWSTTCSKGNDLIYWEP